MPGSYSVEFINMAFAPVKIANVPIEVDKTRFLSAELVEAGIELGVAEVIKYRIPIIDPDNNSTGGTLTNEAIMKIPTREVGTLVSTQPGVYAADDRAAINLKGTRTSSTIYYVNGVKQLGGQTPNLPTSAISQLTVVTGGVPAQYGDAVGGIINITTTSPSNKLSGGIEAETSSPIDQYNNNLLNFNLSGPVIRRKAKEGQESPGALLGFFVAGQYQDSKDDSPFYKGVYQVKADKLAAITAQPLTVYSDEQNPRQSIVPSASLLRLSDLETVKVRPNSSSRRQSYNATFDFQPINNILFSFGGSYDRYKQNLFNDDNSLLNAANNQQSNVTNWNAFARFSQNFPSNGESGLIKNAYYQVQGDFTRYDRVIQNDKFKDKLAKYGYVGRIHEDPLQFRGQFIKVDSLVRTDTMLTRNGVTLPLYTRDPFAPQSLSFTSSGDNPGLALPLTQLLGDPNFGTVPGVFLGSRFSSAVFPFINGNPIGPQNIASVYNGVAGPANIYRLDRNDQYRLSALGAADIGKHTIKVGFEFEQRTISFFGASPNGLWSLARGQINSHLDAYTGQEIVGANTEGEYTRERVGDTDAWVYNVLGKVSGVESDYSKLIRQRLGVSSRAYLNEDEVLNPDNLKLSDFSADQLAVQGQVINYQGYSYLGKRAVNKHPAFSDFFRDTQNRPQDAYRPTYAAGFLEDKFTIEDLIVRVGVRVDRFDANQKVLKDKYAAG